MSSRWFVLSPIKSATQPSQYVAFGCAANARGKLRVGVACTYRRERGQKKARRKWWRFRTGKGFWRGVFRTIEPDRPVWLIAHDAARCFAMVSGFHHLFNRRYYPDLVYAAGKACFLKLTSPQHKILVIDPANWWRAGPDALAEWWEMGRLADNPARLKIREAETRCRREVEITLRAVDVWRELVTAAELGPLRPTVASQAFAAWRYRHYSHAIIMHAHKEATDLERAALYGGRCEVLRPGTHGPGPFYHVDINSAYLAAMATIEVPTRFLRIMHDVSPDRLRVGAERYGLIAEVGIDTDEPRWPKRVGPERFYPRGTFRTALAGAELEDALAAGVVRKCYRVAVYERAPALHDWARWCWRQRCEYRDSGDDALASTMNQLGRSLYGKFSQRSEVTTEVPNAHSDRDGIYPICDAYTEGWQRYVVIEGRRFDTVQQVESLYAFPAIAAFVTAATRSRLWALMQEAGQGNVYYLDTDCLIVDQAGYDRLRHLISRHHLGHLHIDGTTDSIDLRAKKDYRFGPRDKVKGVPANAREVAPGVYVFETAPTGAASLLGRGLTESTRAMRAARRDLTASRSQADPSSVSSPTLAEAL